METGAKPVRARRRDVLKPKNYCMPYTGQAIANVRRRFSGTKSKYLNQHLPTVASADRENKIQNERTNFI